MNNPLILVTNDDGIDSPGLAAAAEALSALGDLLIVAPYRQQSGMGRSLPHDGDHDGRLSPKMVIRNGKSWQGYAAYASPGQAVQHGVLELADRRPSLVVSGINFGENVGTGVTISGTIGAALEASALGIPAMAVSLQTDPSLHVHYNDSVDFSAAMHFTQYFARQWLNTTPIPDVDALKIEVPEDATAQTEWRITRLERQTYYEPVRGERQRLEDAAPIGYRLVYERGAVESDTDAAGLHDGFVAVTPLSLDMTSRVDWKFLKRMLESKDRGGN
jgi:5'/3'-nucleotidase